MITHKTGCRVQFWERPRHHSFPGGNLHGFAEAMTFASLWVGLWWVMLVFWCSPRLRRSLGVDE